MWQGTGLDKHVPQNLDPQCYLFRGVLALGITIACVFSGTAAFLALPATSPITGYLANLFFACYRIMQWVVAMSALPEQLKLNFSKLPKRLNSII